MGNFFSDLKKKWRGLQFIFGFVPWLKRISRREFQVATTWKKNNTFLETIARVSKERLSLLTTYEAYTVCSLTDTYVSSPGAYAEIGTFQGVAAKTICELKGNKKFYVCDTFEGLPEANDADTGSGLTSGDFSSSLEYVQKYLAGFENVQFVQGLFPDSALTQIPENETFCFVHLDIDFYEGTLQSLRYLFPKMISGGAILCHDYPYLPGIEKAIAEFRAETPDAIIIDLPTRYALIIKSPTTAKLTA